jgi:hypothetical protein
VTKTERKEMRDACSELFREPTTEKLSTLLRTMLRQSVTRMPVGVDEFATEPTEERLNKLTASLRNFRQQTEPLETLCRTFYTFQKEPSRRNADSLLAVLPSLDTSGKNAVALAVFLSHPSVEHSLNVRLELTLKQRRDSDLDTERPRDENITVRVPGRRFAVRDAPLFAPYLYLTEDEARRIAVRLMNRLNKELFGHAARRKHDPQRLTALVCHHDKGTRRHLHALLALPPDVTLPAFRNALTRSCRTEPFIYRRTRLEQVNTLAGSIRYNADDFKTLSRNSILYIHTHNPSQQSPRTENTSNETEYRASASRDRAAADDGNRLPAPDAARTFRIGTTCQRRRAERQQLPPQAVAECA